MKGLIYKTDFITEDEEKELLTLNIKLNINMKYTINYYTKDNKMFVTFIPKDKLVQIGPEFLILKGTDILTYELDLDNIDPRFYYTFLRNYLDKTLDEQNFYKDYNIEMGNTLNTVYNKLEFVSQDDYDIYLDRIKSSTYA